MTAWKQVPLEQILGAKLPASEEVALQSGDLSASVKGVANKLVTFTHSGGQEKTVKVESTKLTDPVLGLQPGALFSVTPNWKEFTLDAFPNAPPGCDRKPDIDRNPYNFVAFAGGSPWLESLPDGCKHPGHECWNPTLKHGYIDLKITACTPIFIPKWVQRDTPQTEVRSFYTMKRWEGNQQADHFAIPGSSLKGALRCMVEALANDRFGVMDDAEYYRMPIPYRRRAFNDLKQNPPKYRVGLAKWDGTKWEVKPVDYEKVPGESSASQLLAQPSSHSKYSEKPLNLKYSIPESVVLHYRENLQHQHYAKHLKNCAGNYKPPLDRTKLNEYLAALDLSCAPDAHNLIFFTLKKNSDGKEEVDSFGKNVNYLWPSENSIEELVGTWFPPDKQRTPLPMGLMQPLGLAEQMFGFVSVHGNDSHPFRGKLRFEPLWGPRLNSVTPLGGQNGIQLAPLTAPQSRAKSRPLYLLGRKKNEELHSASYSDYDPTLRGRKFYWKQRYDDAQRENEQLWKFHTKQNGHAAGQLAAPIRPLPKNTVFTTRLHFENLTGYELGVLLFALLGNDPRLVESTQPNTWKSGKHCIHLGKGKPRGLGVCNVEASIRWFNPKETYASLPDTPERKPATQDDIDKLRNAFAEWCTGKANAGKAPAEHKTFADLDHIQDFIHLHTWPDAPSVRYYPPQFKQYSWAPMDNQNPGDPPLAQRRVAMKPARELAP